ncbi:MAG: hypothetical protein ABI647_02395 [Gemmatimonadota bacterium]
MQRTAPTIVRALRTHWVRWAAGPGLAGALLAAPPAHAQMRKAADISATPFPKPTGRFAVGTHDYFWIDERRPEAYTKDPNDKRHLMVQIWYPAEAAPDAKPAPYVRNPDEFANPAEFKPVLHVMTNSVTDAPVAKGEKRYPVLVYNHGGSWNRFSATFTTEQLASHGYVVVSVEHPGFAKVGVFPDGYRFAPDTLQFPNPTGNMRDDVQGSWGYLNDPVFGIWVKDAQFALDKVEELNRAVDSPLRGRLDLEHVGALGWSFGGATAVQLTRTDPRVQAAVDQDGQLFGDVRDLGTSRPVMLLHNTSDPLAGQKPENQAAMKEAVEQVRAWDRVLKEKSTNDWYTIEIAKTTHGNFSDLTLFYPAGPDQIDPRRAHEIINAYTLAFFDRYLRGTSSDLLKEPSAAFPEVTFTRKQ